MPIENFTGNTFVAFTDISGFKKLMKDKSKTMKVLDKFYSTGYNIISRNNSHNGIFVSDCGIMFDKSSCWKLQLSNILEAVKELNKKMLEIEIMLTTSISFGEFNYSNKIELNGMTKNSFHGNGYVNAFLDNEYGTPKIQAGKCRLLIENLPNEFDQFVNEFPLLHKHSKKSRHYYYYWNLDDIQDVDKFNSEYSNSFKLKYDGILKALRRKYHLQSLLTF